jgi:DNA-binding winged helix-turn-helix (wHTH) protein/Tfp pilus assembly protein PilF
MALLRFATFELDEATGELRRSGRRVHLPAQPARMLAYLVRRPGLVVSRDELVRHLWGTETFVAYDQGLNFCLSRIRLALGDSARSPRFIETLPRRGYRFLAPVDHLGPEAAPPGLLEASLPPRPLRSLRPRRRIVAIASAVAVLLCLAQRGAPARAHSRTTATPAARAAFERGLQLSAGTPEERRRSIRAFRHAARSDPQFAEAHYALAHVYLGLAERGQLPAAAALPEARRAAELALALEDIPDTRLVLANVRYYHDWDWRGARRDLDAALRAAPDSDGVLFSYARYLSAVGSDEEAVRAIDRAEARSPSCELVLHESGRIRFRARRYDEAIRKLTQASELGPPRGEDPGNWQRANRFMILRIHIRQNAWPAAAEDALAIMRAYGTAADTLRRFAALEPREGVERFLAGSIRFLRGRAESEYIPSVDLAQIYALHGDAENTFELLDRAARDREPSLAYSLRNPEFDQVRTDPRFLALLKRIGLQGGTSG